MPATVSGRVFVSYRRQDSSGSAGRIYDRLAERFGDDQVFMDVDAIKPGEDFRKVITQKVSTCQVLLAIIGPRWLDQEQWGQRRLEAPDDILRLEIAAALERGIRVIPILVEGAVMPKREELPDDLASLAGRNASTLRHESFHSDADRLLAVIEGILAADVAQRTDPASVDDVNLRATLGPGQVDEGLAVFSLYKREAVRRHIWFCECLEGHGGPVTLPLLARGIILQVRQDAGHAGVATLKLRGPDASIDPELWHRRTQALDDDARIEGDWTADRHLLSVSLNARIQDGLIEEVGCPATPKGAAAVLPLAGGARGRLAGAHRPTQAPRPSQGPEVESRNRWVGKGGRRRAVGGPQWPALPGAIHPRRPRAEPNPRPEAIGSGTAHEGPEDRSGADQDQDRPGVLCGCQRLPVTEPQTVCRVKIDGEPWPTPNVFQNMTLPQRRAARRHSRATRVSSGRTSRCQASSRPIAHTGDHATTGQTDRLASAEVNSSPAQSVTGRGDRVEVAGVLKW